MRRNALITTALLLLTGCVARRSPRWEILVTLNLEQKIDPMTNVKATVGFKRPAAPYTTEKR